MTQFKVVVDFIVYADCNSHARAIVDGLLSDTEGLNDRYEIMNVERFR